MCQLRQLCGSSYPARRHLSPAFPFLFRSTFDDNDRPRILGFLGYVYKYEVMGEVAPTLAWYAQSSFMLKFLAFLVHIRDAGVVRTKLACTFGPTLRFNVCRFEPTNHTSFSLPLCSQAYARGHMTQAIFVLDFLRATKANPIERPLVDDISATYSRMHRQVGRTIGSHPVSSVL